MKRLLKALSLMSIIIPLASCNAQPTVTTLQFDANGGYFGTDKTTTTLSLSGTINESIDPTLYGTPTHLDSDNYIFEGWSETIDGSLLPESLRFPYVNTTIYASWAKKVTITYNTGKASYTHDPEVGYSNRTVTLWEPEIAANDPFVFEGWYTDDQFNEEYDENRFPENDITLYAQFTDFPTITLNYSQDKVVTYQAEGGTKITRNFDAVDIPAGSTFEGWFYNVTADDGSIREVQFFFDYMPRESLDLYPKFETENRVTITYNIGENHTGTIPSLSGLAGTSIDYDDRPNMTAIDFGNYEFLGWYYTDGESGEEVKFVFDVYPTNNLTLTGKWKEYPTITFDCTGYTGLSYNPITQMAGSTLPDLPVPTFTNLEFLYWGTKVTSDPGGVDSYEIFNSKNMPEESITLYPIFKNQRKISIKYTYKGAEVFVDQSKDVYLPTSRDSITTAWWNANVSTPTGYIQNGIYESIYNSSNATNPDKINLPQSPTDDITYYVNLTKEVTVNIFVPENPLWYVDGTEPNFGTTPAITVKGGASMTFNMASIETAIAITGYRVEGFYEAYDNANDEYLTPNNLSVFPEDSNDVVTVFNIYVKYFRNA